MKKYVLSNKSPKKDPLKKLAKSPKTNASVEKILFLLNTSLSSENKKQVSFTFSSSFPNS